MLTTAAQSVRESDNKNNKRPVSSLLRTRNPLAKFFDGTQDAAGNEACERSPNRISRLATFDFEASSAAVERRCIRAISSDNGRWPLSPIPVRPIRAMGPPISIRRYVVCFLSGSKPLSAKNSYDSIGFMVSESDISEFSSTDDMQPITKTTSEPQWLQISILAATTAVPISVSSSVPTTVSDRT
jgi:hypothetical protein